MAERRMFAKTIIDSDAFLDMPLSTQALYFHLSMRADDDGFINNPKKIQRMLGASDDDLKILLSKKFLIPFESGVCVIKHWRIHNYVRNDRYKKTLYQEEKQHLEIKENGAYTTVKIGMPNADHATTIGIPLVGNRDTQVRLGKDSIDKDIYTDEQKQIAEKVYLKYSSFMRNGIKKRAIEQILKILKSKNFAYEDFRIILSNYYDEVSESQDKDPNKIKKFSKGADVFFNFKNEIWVQYYNKEES